jgi:hypothetical protein
MARPSTAPVKRQVNVPVEVAEAIDAYRFANRIPFESEAICRLIKIGLEAAARGPKKP